MNASRGAGAALVLCALLRCSSDTTGGPEAGPADAGVDTEPPFLDGSSDAVVDSAPDSADAGPCTLSKPFGPTKPVPGITGVYLTPQGASLSPDELTIYFFDLPVSGTEMLYATRAA